MPVNEHLEGQWLEWRYAHVSEMFRPYGWTSLVAQYWMHEGDSDVAFELLPGTWSVSGERVMYTPPASGETLSVGGEYPRESVEILPGRNQTYGHGRSVPVYSGRCEVEVIRRTTAEGEQLFGIRVRDPRAASRLEDAGVTAFDYDPSWRLPGRFTPTARVDFEADTVEEGVREVTPYIGTFEFERDGETHRLTVLGKDRDDGSVQPVVHIRDRTSGPISYGAGRVLELQFAEGGEDRIDWIDFNYAVALPCAFTNFVTCPLPPRGNQLGFEVLAGEKRPQAEIARVQTYVSA